MQELQELHAMIDTAAAGADAEDSAMHARISAQYQTVSPKVAGVVLERLRPVYALMGGELPEGTALTDDLAVRALAAVSDAAEDAADSSNLDDAGLVFSVADIVDDASAKVVAAKLSKLATAREFKRWLRSEAPALERPVGEPEASTDDGEGIADDDMKFFEGRI